MRGVDAEGLSMRPTPPWLDPIHNLPCLSDSSELIAPRGTSRVMSSCPGPRKRTRPLGYIPAQTLPEPSSAMECTAAVVVDPGSRSAVRNPCHLPEARLQCPKPSAVPAQMSPRES